MINLIVFLVIADLPCAAQGGLAPKNSIGLGVMPTLWQGVRGIAEVGSFQPIESKARIGWTFDLRYRRSINQNWECDLTYSRIFIPLQYRVDLNANTSNLLEGDDYSITVDPWTLKNGGYFKHDPFIVPVLNNCLALGARTRIASLERGSVWAGLAVGVVALGPIYYGTIDGRLTNDDSLLWLGRSLSIQAPEQEFNGIAQFNVDWDYRNSAFNIWSVSLCSQMIIGNWWGGEYLYFEGTQDELRGRIERSGLYFGLRIGYARSWGAPKESRWVRKARARDAPVE